MAKFTLIARRNGQLELLQGPAAKDVQLNDGDVEVGEFHAENEQEARRQVATANPSVDMTNFRVVIDADADAALAEQKTEFLEKVRAEALDNLEIPDYTGLVEDEEEVEQEDPKTGEKVKKTKKVKKAPQSRRKAKDSKKS